MTSAVYGRMALGRCVEEDYYGSIGCHNDARDVMDVECSGRRECEVLISRRLLRKDTQGSCNSALEGYASLSYTCTPGER